ncbi:hypothetical protein PQR28_06380 [Paraburkholderia sediminicola]
MLLNMGETGDRTLSTSFQFADTVGVGAQFAHAPELPSQFALTASIQCRPQTPEPGYRARSSARIFHDAPRCARTKSFRSALPNTMFDKTRSRSMRQFAYATKADRALLSRSRRRRNPPSSDVCQLSPYVAHRHSQ